jgi:Ser/Thr protein kinase RdoA (MazF antagonist)
MSEMPLHGGRVTRDVIRVGHTVRRPRTPTSEFVASLLADLERRGLGAAPRHLGTDEQGREVFTFIEGVVPAELESDFTDETLASAARLIRRYHDATAASSLAQPAEIVCHNDLSPCNFVFRDGAPVGIIDFDAAAPGSRLQDVGYAIFLWLNLGTDGPAATEQRRRIEVFCDAYGMEAEESVIAAVVDSVSRNIDRLRAGARCADAAWWEVQLAWIGQHREQLVRPRFRP